MMKENQQEANMEATELSSEDLVDETIKINEELSQLVKKLDLYKEELRTRSEQGSKSFTGTLGRICISKPASIKSLNTKEVADLQRMKDLLTELEWEALIDTKVTYKIKPEAPQLKAHLPQESRDLLDHLTVTRVTKASVRIEKKKV